jgi:hypothetical protein
VRVHRIEATGDGLLRVALSDEVAAQ